MLIEQFNLRVFFLWSIILVNNASQQSNYILFKQKSYPAQNIQWAKLVM